MMLTQMRIWLLTGMLVVFAGCGDDEDPFVPEPPVAEILGIMGFDERSGGATLSDSLVVSITVGPFTPEPALLFKLGSVNDLSSIVITVDASTNPEFAEAVSLLTNGVDDYLAFRMERLPGGSGSERDLMESTGFQGGFTGNFTPDFKGARITHVVVAIDVFSHEIPGSDPNNDGIWGDSTFSGRLIIMGHPGVRPD